MSNVFVIQKDPDKDFSKAEKFGKLKYLWGKNRNTYPDNSEARVLEMCDTARTKLDSFRPFSDYLLVNGDPVGIVIVTAALVDLFDWEEEPPPLKLLKWDAQQKDYYVVEVPINILDRS